MHVFTSKCSPHLFLTVKMFASHGQSIAFMPSPQLDADWHLSLPHGRRARLHNFPSLAGTDEALRRTAGLPAAAGDVYAQGRAVVYGRKELLLS